MRQVIAEAPQFCGEVWRRPCSATAVTSWQRRPMTVRVGPPWSTRTGPTSSSPMSGWRRPGAMKVWGPHWTAVGNTPASASCSSPRHPNRTVGPSVRGYGAGLGYLIQDRMTDADEVMDALPCSGGPHGRGPGGVVAARGGGGGRGGGGAAARARAPGRARALSLSARARARLRARA